MAFLKAIFMMLMMMGVCGISMAAVYEVGGSVGWTIMGGVDYQNWAASNNFHVGDTLLFNYNNQCHNIKQVTLQNFKSCNATSPIATYTNGSDLVTLDKEGHCYFICGYPGHYQLGQKVDILVVPSSPSPSPVSPPRSSALVAAASSWNFASEVDLAFMVLTWIFI